MTKTLWMAKETTNAFEVPSYIKVTASKIEEIEEGIQNLYKDDKGNRYIVRYNRFLRRHEFVKM